MDMKPTCTDREVQTQGLMDVYVRTVSTHKLKKSNWSPSGVWYVRIVFYSAVVSVKAQEFWYHSSCLQTKNERQTDQSEFQQELHYRVPKSSSLIRSLVLTANVRICLYWMNLVCDIRAELRNANTSNLITRPGDSEGSCDIKLISKQQIGL